MQGGERRREDRKGRGRKALGGESLLLRSPYAHEPTFKELLSLYGRGGTLDISEK
jgi:hypothetical protein